MTQKYRRPGEHAEFVRNKIVEKNTMWGRQEEAPLDPSVDVIEKLLDVAFFASLLTEEGRPLRVSLAYAPEVSSAPLPSSFRRLSSAIPLNPRNLRKLSPALNPQRSSVAVRLNGDELEVWVMFQCGDRSNAGKGEIL